MDAFLSIFLFSFSNIQLTSAFLSIVSMISMHSIISMKLFITFHHKRKTSLPTDTLLTKKNIQVNLQNSNGFFPCHAVALSGSAECFETLLERIVINVNLTSYFSHTLLYCAIYRKQLEAIWLLLTHNDTYVHAQNPHGNTPLSLFNHCRQFRIHKIHTQII